MTRDELEALASRIAELLGKQGWVPGPVRPEPPGRPTPGHLPAWAAAAQNLSDVAPTPGRRTGGGRHRAAYAELAVAARAAAAARGPSPLPGGKATAASAGAAGGRSVPIAISNRHIHITQADFERLFGAGKQPTPERPISQPGQFAATETITVAGPRGSIEGVRIVGPARKLTQVELSVSDCRRIGVDAPVRHSGAVGGSAGIRLEGPAGSVSLGEGLIIAARHIHVHTRDAAALGVADGDRVTVRLGSGDRGVTLGDVLIRSGDTHATEMHLDTDEAGAFGIKAGDRATLIGRPQRGRSRNPVREGHRPLLTERDVDQLVARGETLGYHSPYRFTPLAKDRARALGVWRDEA